MCALEGKNLQMRPRGIAVLICVTSQCCEISYLFKQHIIQGRAQVVCICGHCASHCTLKMRAIACVEGNNVPLMHVVNAGGNSTWAETAHCLRPHQHGRRPGGQSRLCCAPSMHANSTSSISATYHLGAYHLRSTFSMSRQPFCIA